MRSAHAPLTPRSHPPRGRGIADLAELDTDGATLEPNAWSGGGPVNQPPLHDDALYTEPAASQSSSIAAQPVAPPGAQAEPWAGQTSHDVRGAAAHPFDTSGETWDRTLTCGRRTVGSARALPHRSLLPRRRSSPTRTGPVHSRRLQLRACGRWWKSQEVRSGFKKAAPPSDGVTEHLDRSTLMPMQSTSPKEGDGAGPPAAGAASALTWAATPYEGSPMRPRGLRAAPWQDEAAANIPTAGQRSSDAASARLPAAGAPLSKSPGIMWWHTEVDATQQARGDRTSLI